MQEMYTCDHCGEEFPLEETLLVEGDRLCRHCAARLTALCDECGTRIYLEHDEGDSNRFLCSSCSERYYTRCDRCNTLIYNENVYEYDGENWNSQENRTPNMPGYATCACADSHRLRLTSGGR